MARPIPRREDLHALRRTLEPGCVLTLPTLSEPEVADLVAASVGGPRPRPDRGNRRTTTASLAAAIADRLDFMTAPARTQAAFRMYGIRRGPRVRHGGIRQGWAAPPGPPTGRSRRVAELPVSCRSTTCQQNAGQ
jgi:hypothetical protein